MAPAPLTDAPRPAPASGPFRAELVLPPHAGGARADDGLKLDWQSEVGHTGLLLRWQPVGRGDDAGVPPEVARAIATGLCAAGTVAGCTLDVPDTAGAAWVAVPGGHACRLARGWWERPRHIGLLASDRPDVVERLFEDDGFPWSLESQVLFVAPPGALPQLDAALVLACLAVPIRASVAQLVEAGVRGLLVAGVDGDVAGLYALNAEWRARLVQHVGAAVVAAGAQWETVDACPASTTADS